MNEHGEPSAEPSRMNAPVSGANQGTRARGLARRRLVIASVTTPVVLKLGMRGASGKTKKSKSTHASAHHSVKTKKHK
ncbi:MAG TPA: hypothetical protein VLX09_22915 [Stellaceae bacterium]|nr:hypothetical protein [Stellaceae bacterium]